MRRVIVRYRVKQDHQQENEDYIHKVFAELNNDRPAGLRYATFRATDSPIFFHVASVETENGVNPLTVTEAFKKFSANIADRCDEPPVTTELETIGSYNFFN